MSEKWRLEPEWTQVAPSAFVAANVVLVGDVWLGDDASVWFGSVLRGDNEAIRIGARANVQDGTVVHADPGFPTHVADEVTIGHRCVIHGARIGRCSLIGMNAVLMNGCEIGEQSIVGAGAVVTGGRVFPPRSLILGAPARVVRPLTEDEVVSNHSAAQHYVDAGRAYIAAGFTLPRL